MTGTRAVFHAVRVGLARGWTEFVLSLRSPQDQGFYLVTGVLTVGYLYMNRANELTGTGLLLPTVALPSILGALVVFSVIIGPASALAIEREDGTVLRVKAVPYGITGYVTGQLLLHTVSLLPLLAIVLVPAMVLFDGVMHRGAAGWLTVVWVLALGLLATLPVGIIVGSLSSSVMRVWTWGWFSFVAVVAISGIFAPIVALWGWVQGVAQVFPIYWIGLGMRSAFLPDTALAVEIGGSWRTTETVIVLAAWAVAGLLVAPVVVRRMARRQTGAAMQQARDAVGQWVK